MDTTSKWLLGLSLALALLVGLGVYVALANARSLSRATATVVVTRQEIPERTRFTAANLEELLTTSEVPAEVAPQGALTTPSAAIGKATTIRLAPGEPVLGTDDRLASAEGATVRPAAIIPRDKLALTIPATESMSVAGAAQPGDRVDVIATWTRPSGRTVTEAVFQDIQVFAVGRWQNDGRGRPSSTAASTITLLLDHQQALILEYLLQTGARVSLGLRRFDQGGDVATEPVTPESLARRWPGLDPEDAIPPQLR